MGVIFIRLADVKKKQLEDEARKLAMPLTTYCRMILLKTLESKSDSDK